MKKSCILLIILAIAVMVVSCSNKTSEPVQMSYGSGSHVARINVRDYGAIDLRLFETQAPEAVHLFIEAANNGDFNGTDVSSIIKDYYLSISPNNAESYITDSAAATNNDLYPFNGALFVPYTNSKPISLSSFYIISSSTDNLHNLYKLLSYKELEPKDYFSKAYGTNLTDEDLELYESYGGAPWMQGHCIVFGQITNGFEILEMIMESDLSESSAPVQPIIIESVEIK